MKKRNLTLKILIVLIIIFIVLLTIYKFNYKESNNDKENLNIVGDKIIYNNDENYAEVYKENIINQNKIEVQYQLYNDSKEIYGKVFISSDLKLYISDESNNKQKLLLNVKCKTINLPNDNIDNGFYILVLSEEGKLYSVELSEPNITKVVIEEIELPSRVINFTDLDIGVAGNPNSNSAVVFCEDGKMYDVNTKIQYNVWIENILDKYIVYNINNNRYITNIDGNVLLDSNKNKYIADTVLIASKPVDELKYKPTILIITKDKKLIYLIDDDRVYEYGVGVSEVEDMPNINIIFKNGKNIKFDGVTMKFYFGEEN